MADTLQPTMVEHNGLTNTDGLICKAHSKKIIVPSTQEAEISAKQQRLESLNTSSFPCNYRCNSNKEKIVLEYVENFRRQFVQLFPERKELLLCPLNECGARKFVCSSVRPTLLEFPRTYQLQTCVTFIADFFKYTVLESPLKLPDFLPSPSTVIAMREGDCVDISTVLVSVLRGSGFSAHVVSGYAPMHITLQDVSTSKCPLEATTVWLDDDDIMDDEKEALIVPDGRYKLEKRNTTKSEYLSMIEKQQEDERAQQNKSKEPPTESLQKFLYEDELNDKRVHCWVLVSSGSRDIEQSVFVEPSTGAIYPLGNAPYLGIESMWNDINYWVNVQNAPISSMIFDTNDSNAWEFVLIEKVPPIDNSIGTELSDEQYKTSDEGNANDLAAVAHKAILEPSSWPKRIEIERNVFESVYPEGKKIMYYERCNVEKYSDHYEGMKGLILKLTFFHDDERQRISEVRELFSRRRDLLVKRVTIPDINCTKLLYDPGQPSGIKSLVEIPDHKRTMHFYKGSRVDGLVRRIEIINEKIVEQYTQCDDFLQRRVIIIEPPTSTIRRLKGFSINPSGNGEYPVRKIIETFRRNTSLRAENDVRERTHSIAKGQIRLDYHYAKDRITASNRTYNKDGKNAIGWQADTHSQKPRANKLRTEFERLVVAEKSLMTEIRTREADFIELRAQLEIEANEVVLDKTVEEKARDQSIEHNIKAKNGVDDSGKSSDEVDYLSPFVAQFPTGKPLTQEQAEQARDECMSSLTERLLERANIIQRRLNSENEILKKRETAYQRSQGAHSDKDDEEFNEFCEQTMFRIHILDARLHRHEKMAMKKFKLLDTKLRADERLEMIYRS